MFRSNWICLLCLVTLAGLVGCPRGKPGLKTVAVTGTVTLDGQPVDGASVAFSPKAPDGKAAVGLTDSSGKFTLKTDGTTEGALPGSYTVTVSKTSGGSADSAAMQPPSGQMSAEETAAMAKKAEEMMRGGGAVEAKDLLPAKYKSPATSGLTAEVKKGGENNFTFELLSK